MPPELAAIRREIDAIDDALLVLLQRRSQAVARAWQHKAVHGQARHDPAREAAILARLHAQNAGSGLAPQAVAAVFAAVLAGCQQAAPPSVPTHAPKP